MSTIEIVGGDEQSEQEPSYLIGWRVPHIPLLFAGDDPRDCELVRGEVLRLMG